MRDQFGPTLIRCTKCGLEHWECTTSDYLLQVGQIVNRWREDYSADEDGIESLQSDLENIHDELEEKLDNMPEGLQEGDAGQLLQERMDAIDDTMNELDSIDADDLRNEAAREYMTDHEDDEDLKDVDLDDLPVDEYEYVQSYLTDEAKSSVDELFEEKMGEAIDEALNCLEV